MKREEVPRVYAIADREALGDTPLERAVTLLAQAGIRWIQIRAKGMAGEPLRKATEACLRAVEGGRTEIWIDDRVDLAALLPVAGVHVGQEDLPPGEARRILGDGPWIGHSTHGLAQLTAAAADPAVDLIAVGPVYPTTGKRDPDPVVGPGLVREARRLTDKPLVAIGGITAERVGEVLEAGADAVAVLGAVCRGDLSENARRLLAAAGES